MRKAPKIAVAGLLGVAACGGGLETFDYVSRGPVNLTVGAADMDDQRFRRKFTNIAIQVETSRCKFEYVGSVVLGSSAQQIGVPTGTRVLLGYNFIDNGGLINGNREHSATNQIVTFRPGASYQVDMAYHDNTPWHELRENGKAVDLPEFRDICP